MVSLSLLDIAHDLLVLIAIALGLGLFYGLLWVAYLLSRALAWLRGVSGSSGKPTVLRSGPEVEEIIKRLAAEQPGSRDERAAVIGCYVCLTGRFWRDISALPWHARQLYVYLFVNAHTDPVTRIGCVTDEVVGAETGLKRRQLTKAWAILEADRMVARCYASDWLWYWLTNVDYAGYLCFQSYVRHDQERLSGAYTNLPAEVVEGFERLHPTFCEARPAAASVEGLRALAYNEYLATHHWKLRREGALARANHRCQACHATKGLRVHHRSYDRLGCEADADLVVLCADCHARVHERREELASVRAGQGAG